MGKYLVVLIRRDKNGLTHRHGYIKSKVRGDYGKAFSSYNDAENAAYKYIQEEYSRTGKEYDFRIVKILENSRDE